MADASGAGAAQAAVAIAPARSVQTRRRYALVVLTIVYLSSHIDRSIVGILAQSIKVELGLSDTALGFLSGFAFAAFYATLGIPLAVLADRANRRNIIALAVGFWSAMTAVCGLAQSYTQLVLARIGVGIGEAGSSPQSHSMIADMYAPHERSRAMAVYTLGVPLGTMLGFLIGGYVSTLLGWRAAFFVVGLPGIALALLVWLTVPEPKRGHADGLEHAGPKKQSLREIVADLSEAFVFIWRSRACRHVVLGLTLTSFVGYGTTMLGAAFIERTFKISPLEIGMLLGPFAGLAGAAGALLGGYLADRFGARDPRWCAWVIGLAKFLAVPFILAFYLIDDFIVASLFYLPAAVLGAFYLGPSFAMIQSVAPLKMRATAAAITLFILNFIALGLGPLTVGALSDALNPVYGSDSLRYSLLLTSLINIWAALHYGLAGRAYAQEIRAANPS